MARAKYYYNPKTCNYERIQPSARRILLKTAGFLASSLVTAVGILAGYTAHFDSPKEQQLKQENSLLKLHYSTIQQEIEKSKQALARLQDQDDNVYRLIFEAEPIPASMRQAGVGGTDRYQEIKDKNELIAATVQKVDQLKRQLYIQSKSYDKILQLAKSRKKQLAALPAIRPISSKDLRRLSSPFGMRLHPLYGVNKMHEGVDFAAPQGTPIYATGDGVIKIAKHNRGNIGYGNWIEVSHGYGLSTRYAHLQSFTVKVGQKVKRGDCIGYVGKTGGATAPHVHYEVRKNRKSINPIYYFINDLNASEYEELVRIASHRNQSLS